MLNLTNRYNETYLYENQLDDNTVSVKNYIPSHLTGLKHKGKYFSEELPQIDENKGTTKLILSLKKRENMRRKASLIKEERRKALTKPNEVYTHINE